MAGSEGQLTFGRIVTSDQESSLLDRFTESRTLVWLAAVVLFGLGDLGLTLVGLASGHAEVHPLAGTAVITYGPLVLIPLKIAVIALFYLIYRLTPDEFDVGVPIGLTLIGSAVVLWNTYALLV